MSPTGRLEVSSDHWYTPLGLMQEVGAFFHTTFYDPTTSPSVLARYPSHLRSQILAFPEEDFLARKTLPCGNVWMNPPYSRDVGGAGVFTDHLLALKPTCALVLVNAATSTRWWQRLASASSAICFVSPRICFDRYDGFKGVSPRYSNCLHFLSLTEKESVSILEFVAHFSNLGVIK